MQARFGASEGLIPIPTDPGASSDICTLQVIGDELHLRLGGAFVEIQVSRV